MTPTNEPVVETKVDEPVAAPVAPADPTPEVVATAEASTEDPATIADGVPVATAPVGVTPTPSAPDSTAPVDPARPQNNLAS